MVCDGINLRAVELSDVDIIYEYENDWRAWQDGVNDAFCSHYAVEQYVLSTQQGSVFSSNQVRLMIEVINKTGKQPIGCVDLYDIDARHLRAGVGVYIDVDYRGNGYSKQALKKLEEYAFQILNLHQLYAFVRSDNMISLSLFEKCKYMHTATLKDWLKQGVAFKDVNVFQKQISNLQY